MRRLSDLNYGHDYVNAFDFSISDIGVKLEDGFAVFSHIYNNVRKFNRMTSQPKFKYPVAISKKEQKCYCFLCKHSLVQADLTQFVEDSIVLLLYIWYR